MGNNANKPFYRRSGFILAATLLIVLVSGGLIWLLNPQMPDVYLSSSAEDPITRIVRDTLEPENPEYTESEEISAALRIGWLSQQDLEKAGTTIYALDPLGLIVNRELFQEEDLPSDLRLLDWNSIAALSYPNREESPGYNLVVAGGDPEYLTAFFLSLFILYEPELWQTEISPALSAGDTEAMGIQNRLLSEESPLYFLLPLLDTWAKTGVLPEDWIEWTPYSIQRALEENSTYTALLWNSDYLGTVELPGQVFIGLPSTGGVRGFLTSARFWGSVGTEEKPKMQQAIQELLSSEEFSKRLYTDIGLFGTAEGNPLINNSHRAVLQRFRGYRDRLAFPVSWPAEGIWPQLALAIETTYRLNFLSKTN